MQFTINKRVIKKTNEMHIGDNADYEASFSFDEEWENDIKTARFEMGGKYVDVLLCSDRCSVPAEILKKGNLRVGVFSDTKTTTFCNVPISESIKEKNGVPVPPRDDIYSQIIKMIENIEVSGVSDEQIEKAVTKYFSEHPIDALTEDEVQRIVSEYVKNHMEELKGKNGIDGKDGYSPQKGVDYWTAEDISEIKSYIDTWIGGALNGSY